MTSTDLIFRLRQHQLWVNRTLLDACAPLSDAELRQSFAIGQGSVLSTIVHLYAAEYVWLAAIEGNPNPMSPFDIRFDSLSDLIEAWNALDVRWKVFFDELEKQPLERQVDKKSTSSGAGKSFSTSLADVLLHLFTHAQYTAAQLKNMLRQLGKAPLPDVMLITLARRETLGQKS